jgi:hypothetical protein
LVRRITKTLPSNRMPKRAWTRNIKQRHHTSQVAVSIMPPKLTQICIAIAGNDWIGKSGPLRRTPAQRVPHSTFQVFR